MDLTRVRKSKSGDNSGIALFMVISAVAVLSILVTEFTYIAQVSQKIAYDSLDQVKVHYIAKSAYKLSLLRLKAFQTVTDLVKSGGGGAGPIKIPRGVLDKIWSFPFFFPIPGNLPGMTPSQKESIDKFQNESGLDGKFSSVITSESSKLNLNMVLAPFVTASPSPTPATPAASTQSGDGTQQPPPPVSPVAAAPEFKKEEYQQTLSDYLTQLVSAKFEADPDFADEYRDFKMEDLMDNLLAWVDREHPRRNSGSTDQVAFKGGPFYTLSELRMIPPINDELYDVFAPNLTATTTPGLNVNTLNAATLKALYPRITKEESDEFFKFRDSEEADNTFKTEDDFFKYVSENISSVKNTPDKIKEDMQKRKIRIVLDETQFKISVQAQVNQATRIMEAWVTLTKPTSDKATAPNPQARGAAVSEKKTRPNAGLKVTFMRFL